MGPIPCTGRSCGRAAARAFLVVTMVVLFSGIEWKEKRAVQAKKAKSEVNSPFMLLLHEAGQAVSASSVHAPSITKDESDGNSGMAAQQVRDVYGNCPVSTPMRSDSAARYHPISMESQLCSELRWVHLTGTGAAPQRATRGQRGGKEEDRRAKAGAESSQGPTAHNVPATASAKACSFLRQRLALGPGPGVGDDAGAGAARTEQQQGRVGSATEDQQGRALRKDGGGSSSTGTSSTGKGSLGSRTSVPLSSAPPSQTVCGINMDREWLDTHCGRVVPESVDEGGEGHAEGQHVHTDRDVDPLSRSAPRTFLIWNKALASGCDVGPRVVLDDTHSLDVEWYKDSIRGWRDAEGSSGSEHGSVKGTAVTIYVITTQLPPFFEHIVPFLRSLDPPQPYILMTGGSDVPGPVGGLSTDGKQRGAFLAEALGDSLLWAWFAQNPDYRHAKVVPLPIGFDFHTLADPALADAQGKTGRQAVGGGRVMAAGGGSRQLLEAGWNAGQDEAVQPSAAHAPAPAPSLSEAHARARALQVRGSNGAMDWDTRPAEVKMHSWGPALSAQAQDWSLSHLRCTLPALTDRPVAALLNFKTAGRGVRSTVAGLLQSRPGVITITDTPRAELWRRYGEVSFVISPRGYGKDCHRTWEALALGAIPVVSHDAFLMPLYDRLPVVVVERWGDVTREALAVWKEQVLAKWDSYRWELLRTDWWLYVAHWVATAPDASGAAQRLDSIWHMDGVEGTGQASRAPRGSFQFPS